MVIFALAMAQAAVPGTATPTIGQLPERCVPKERRVSGQKPSYGQHRLNELPDAEPRFAVLREIDGCPIPARVNQALPRP